LAKPIRSVLYSSGVAPGYDKYGRWPKNDLNERNFKTGDFGLVSQRLRNFKKRWRGFSRQKHW